MQFLFVKKLQIRGGEVRHHHAQKKKVFEKEVIYYRGSRKEA